MRTLRGYVMGLDLSLRGAGICIVPFDWCSSMQWGRVHAFTFGIPLTRDATQIERANRTDMISKVIYRKAQEFGVKYVFIEHYSFGSEYNREALGELGGVVKRDLAKEVVGIRLIDKVTVRAARKLIFGPIKRGVDIKPFVRDKLMEMGARFDTQDEYDAFVIANWGLCMTGNQCLMAA